MDSDRLGVRGAGTLDDFCLWLARHLPKRLVYWCALTVVSFATTGKFSKTQAPKLTAMGALQRFERAYLTGGAR
jgi:hypothetical protein